MAEVKQTEEKKAYSYFEVKDRTGKGKKSFTLDEVNTLLKDEHFLFNPDEQPDFAWLEYTDGAGSNLDRIVKTYTPQEKKKYKDDIDNKRPPIVKTGTTLIVDSDYVEAVIAKLENSKVFMTPVKDYSTYWNAQQKRLTEDKGYVPFFKNERKLAGAVQQKPLNAKVWVYIDALDALYDISPFVRTMSTSKNMQSGSFSIELVPISNAGDIQFDMVNTFLTSKGSSAKKVVDLFSAGVQHNDMVFIRFEALQLENTVGDRENPLRLQRSFTDLTSGMVWDMIGFVDTVTPNVNYDANDYTVTVTGRDYMKLLADDGISFLPDFMLYGGKENLMLTTKQGEFLERNVSGETMYGYGMATLKSNIGFVFERCSKISIVSNTTMTETASRYNEQDKDEALTEDRNPKGVWKLFKVWVDPALEDRELLNTALVNPDGSLLDLISRSCQQPFVEFFGDTWGAGFDFMVRKPPFDKASILKVVSAGDDKGVSGYVTIENNDVLAHSLAFDDRVYSWYKIMPTNAMFTSLGEGIQIKYFPIFYIDDYVSRYGNKRNIIQDPYIFSGYAGGAGGNESLNYALAGMVSDYIFAIESTVYLPFTRKGTITINGDRRIKVGTFVKLDLTDELFYVTAVNNSISFGENSVDRTTVLTVERGMKMYNITDPQGNTYFNIVDIDGLRKNLTERVKNADSKGDKEVDGTVQPVTIINRSVFEYFRGRLNYLIPAGVAYSLGTNDKDGMVGYVGNSSAGSQMI